MYNKKDAVGAKDSNSPKLHYSYKYRFEIVHLRYKLDEYKRKFEIEKNIKNNLYAFILSQGLFNQLQDYEMNNDMRSSDGFGLAIEYLKLNFPENKN